jgi:hypothetical protein
VRQPARSSSQFFAGTVQDGVQLDQHVVNVLCLALREFSQAVCVNSGESGQGGKGGWQAGKPTGAAVTQRRRRGPSPSRAMLPHRPPVPRGGENRMKSDALNERFAS